MISFIISLVVLVLGYLLYGKFVAHVFGKKPFIITLVPAVFMTVVCFYLLAGFASGIGTWQNWRFGQYRRLGGSVGIVLCLAS